MRGALSDPGDVGQLEVVSVELDPSPTRVFNLEVAEAHTYAAGELAAWVHNAGPGGILGFTKHGLNQAINRGIKPANILAAVRTPLKVFDDVARGQEGTWVRRQQ